MYKGCKWLVTWLFSMIIWLIAFSMPIKHGSTPINVPKLNLLVRKLLLKITDFTNVVWDY